MTSMRRLYRSVSGQGCSIQDPPLRSGNLEDTPRPGCKVEFQLTFSSLLSRASDAARGPLFSNCGSKTSCQHRCCGSSRVPHTWKFTWRTPRTLPFHFVSVSSVRALHSCFLGHSCSQTGSGDPASRSGYTNQPRRSYAELDPLRSSVSDPTPSKVTGTIPPVLTPARATAAPTPQDFPYRFLHDDFAFEGNMEEAPCLVKAEGELTAWRCDFDGCSADSCFSHHECQVSFSCTFEFSVCQFMCSFLLPSNGGMCTGSAQTQSNVHRSISWIVNDDSQWIAPLRGHIDSVTRLMKGDIRILRGSTQRDLGPSQRKTRTKRRSSVGRQNASTQYLFPPAQRSHRRSGLCREFAWCATARRILRIPL